MATPQRLVCGSVTVAVSAALRVSCSATTPIGAPVHGRELVRPLTSITPESRIFTNDHIKCAKTAGQGGDNPCKRSFGSHHTGGANFVMCDGSVRFIRYSVDMNLLAFMATISGGEVADVR